MLKGIKRWLSRMTGTYSVQDDAILLYYLSILEVRVRWLSSGLATGSNGLALLEEVVDNCIELEQSVPGTHREADAWIKAYRLERLMALLEPYPNLVAEIGLRLDEALAERVGAEPRLRAAFAALKITALDSSKSDDEKTRLETELRSLLLEILEETHWTKNRKFYMRPLQKRATRRIVWAGLFSFVLFLLPYLLIFIHVYFLDTGAQVPAERRLPSEHLVGLPFYTALTAGLFGAYFSRLHYIQAMAATMSVGELRAAKEFASIFLRGVVGMCGALVVFFFLRSGIVSGKLFPDFTQLNVKEGAVRLFDSALKGESVRQILPSEALALLAIWCFLAGFSERLVPSILSSTEQTLGDAAKNSKN